MVLLKDGGGVSALTRGQLTQLGLTKGRPRRGYWSICVDRPFSVMCIRVVPPRWVGAVGRLGTR